MLSKQAATVSHRPEPVGAAVTESVRRRVDDELEMGA